jgi:hypothetical protein
VAMVDYSPPPFLTLAWSGVEARALPPSVRLLDHFRRSPHLPPYLFLPEVASPT